MNDSRAAQIQWATWIYDHRSQITWSEGPERMNAIGVWPPKLPISLDCSAFCTLVAWLAKGNDPNGLGFNHTGYTGTMLSHCLHIAQGAVIRGDYVVYGPGTGEHVAFVVEVHGPDILTLSMGQNGDPEYAWVNTPTTVPSRGYPVDGRQPQTFLANHTDVPWKYRTPLDIHPVKKLLAPLTFFNNAIQKMIAFTKKP